MEAFQCTQGPGGDTLWSEDALVLEKNSRGFPARLRRCAQNAERVADFLRGHPKGMVYTLSLWCPDGGTCDDDDAYGHHAYAHLPV